MVTESEMYRYMLEVAKGAGFVSITDAIVAGRKWREAGLTDANQPAGIEGQIRHLMQCVRDDVDAGYEAKMSHRTELAENRLKVLIRLAISHADGGKESASEARDAERYRWLRDRTRDDRMEMANNTDSDMDCFIDEQIAKEAK